MMRKDLCLLHSQTRISAARQTPSGDGRNEEAQEAQASRCPGKIKIAERKFRQLKVMERRSSIHAITTVIFNHQTFIQFFGN